jgi:hypothetical protein
MHRAAALLARLHRPRAHLVIACQIRSTGSGLGLLLCIAALIIQPETEQLGGSFFRVAGQVVFTCLHVSEPLRH